MYKVICEYHQRTIGTYSSRTNAINRRKKHVKRSGHITRVVRISSKEKYKTGKQLLAQIEPQDE